MDRIVLFAILIFLYLTEHDVRNLIASVSPDIDDLVVALAVSNDSTAVLLIHLFNLLVCVLQLGCFAFWNDHVLDSNRDAGASGFLKPQLFQLVQRSYRDGRASSLITPPDDIAELFLARRLVKETEFFWPNLIENDATGSCLDNAHVGIAKTGLAPAVRIFEENPVMRFDGALDHCEFHFERVRKKRQMMSVLLWCPRILRYVIATKGDVLTRGCDRFATRRGENIVGREHQHTCFQLRLD